MLLKFKSRACPAYVQVSGFLVNGKTELRACGGSAGIDKSQYKSLAKINLTSVKTLERVSDGSFAAEIGSATAVCVVPSNIKFDKEGSLKPSDLIDMSTFTGQVLGSMPAGITALPRLTKGVKFVSGSATDAELAEYLLADRSSGYPGGGGHTLGKYPAAAHAAPAKGALVSLGACRMVHRSWILTRSLRRLPRRRTTT